MYVPFDQNENTLKHNFPTWEAAYIAYETTIQTNEARFTYNVNPRWGDLENALDELENPSNVDETLTNHKTTRTLYESYDLQEDFPCPRATAIEKRINLVFQVTKNHFFIENNKYYRVRILLNREQQEILKDIAMKKCLNMHTLVHLFLTCGAGT